MTMAWASVCSWVPLFAGYLIKSTVVLALALILAVLLRKRPASLRHFVLSLSLAGLLLLPVLSYFGGGWETSFLPARAGGPSLSPAVPAAAKADEDGQVKAESKGVPFWISHSSVALKIAKPVEQAPAGASGLFFKSVLPSIWSAGLILLLLRLAAGLFGAFRLTREGETIRDPGWRVLLERFLAAIHLQRRVRLKSHRDIRIPLTCGFIRPVVLIPDGHEAWTEEQRSSTLIHELSHIKRADFLVMMLVRLSLALFWFNPLSWVVFRRLKNEQEEACDELVLKTGVKPSTYAANLLFFKTAAGSRLGHFAALVGLFGFGKSAFNQRLAAILKQKWTFQEVKMKTKILLFCAVILAVALIGLARPSSPETEEAESAMGILTTTGSGVSESISSLPAQGIQTSPEGQVQSQAEEKKSQDKKPQEQAQAQEEKKQKEEKKPAVLVTVKEGEKHRHVITIKEGDKIKTITVDKPVIIKEGAKGKVILITPEGEEVTVLEGEPVHLEVKADNLELIRAGKILKVGKEGGVVYIIGEPDIDIGKAVEVTVGQEVDTAAEAALVEVPVPVKVAEPMTAHVILEPDVKVDSHVTPHLTWVSEDLESEIRGKLRDIREKLKEVEEKKLELREVDEALADLEKDLEKMSQETSSVAHVHTDKPEVFTIVKKRGGEEVAAQTEPDIEVEIAERVHEHPVKVVVKEEGAFSLYYEVNAGGKGRETYERIVARVKKDLPEGFTLEPEFEEESGLITLRVNGPFGKGAPHDLVQKLADSIRDETREKKE
jgi:beta-lactamase regulating signal transducer with metallopeptidase domain